MGVPPRVLSRLESAPKNGMDPDRIKIIRRYDASSGDLGAVANAERRPHNFRYKNCVKQRATPLQVDEIWPGNTSIVGFAARRPGKDEKPFLVPYQGTATEQDSFDPTPPRGIASDAQREAKTR